MSGDYDNILQDSQKYSDSNVVIIFWELCNITDGLQYKVELFDEELLDDIFQKTKCEINLVLKNVEKTPLVLINKFTSLQFSISNIRKNNFDELASKLNHHLLRLDLTQKMENLNSYFSASGIITFSNSADLQKTFSKIPNNKLLVETDSPFLAPAPMRGKKNEPSFIKYTIKKLAELKELDEAEMTNITSKNFENLFFS